MLAFDVDLLLQAVDLVALLQVGAHRRGVGDHQDGEDHQQDRGPVREARPCRLGDVVGRPRSP